VIYGLVHKSSASAPERPFVIHRDRVCSYREALQRAGGLATALVRRRLRRFLVYLEDSVDLVCLLLAADLAGSRVGVLNAASRAEDVDRLAADTGIEDVVVRAPVAGMNARQVAFDSLTEPSPEEPPPPPGPEAGVVIFTTGTTGRPKGAVYAWEDLVAQVRMRSGLEESVWLLLYNLNHFAGYQVLMHVFCNGATLVIPDSREPRRALEAMRRWRVSHVSSTPTFWRMFLGQIGEQEAADLAVRQITVGGEAVSSDVIERLDRAFPKANVSQVYATTELGACFSVKDGRPGFPVSLLDNPEREIQLKIVDGELYVKAPHAMRAYLGGEGWKQGDWNATGDMVCVQGDRVQFLGRKSEVMNVGGVKVHPLEIESLIQAVPGVLSVRVYGRKNPVMGHLVAADVVAEQGACVREVEKAIRERCAGGLDRYRQPRLIQFVPALATANHKLVRRDGEGANER
jgi:acyl-CoA synthetase (AMP-forming)/AMP-acid ligase II